MSTISAADWAAAEQAAEVIEQKRGAEVAPAAEKPKDAPAPKDEKPAEPPEKKAAAGPENEPGAADDADAKADEEAAKEPEKGGVATAERIKFREEKRRFKATMQAEVDRVQAQLSERETALSSRFGPHEKAAKAFEAGDPDGFAQALGAKDWNDLQAQMLRTASAPGYQQLRKLQKTVEEQKEREEKEVLTRRQQAEQEQMRAQQERAFTGIRDSMTKHGGLASEFATDPSFVAFVLAEKRKAFEEGDEDITDMEAAERAIRSVADIHERMWERFEKHEDHEVSKRVLSRRQAQNAASRPQERATPEKGKKPHVSHSRPAEAGQARPMTDKEAFAELARQMANSEP